MSDSAGHADHIAKVAADARFPQGTASVERNGFKQGMKDAADTMRAAKTPQDGRQAIQDKLNEVNGRPAVRQGNASPYTRGSISGMHTAINESSKLERSEFAKTPAGKVESEMGSIRQELHEMDAGYREPGELPTDRLRGALREARGDGNGYGTVKVPSGSEISISQATLEHILGTGK